MKLSRKVIGLRPFGLAAWKNYSGRWVAGLVAFEDSVCNLRSRYCGNATCEGIRRALTKIARGWW
jgi:hypothetical protein